MERARYRKENKGIGGGILSLVKEEMNGEELWNSIKNEIIGMADQVVLQAKTKKQRWVKNEELLSWKVLEVSEGEEKEIQEFDQLVGVEMEIENCLGRGRLVRRVCGEKPEMSCTTRSQNSEVEHLNCRCQW